LRARHKPPVHQLHPTHDDLSCFRLWQISAAAIALFVAGSATAQTPAKLDPPVKPTVTGKFVGNGKNAATKFVIVEEHEPFGDREAITLLFTEKDPAKSKKPSFDAMFGELGSALKLSVDYDGKIFGCEVAHSAHSKQGFTSLGIIKMVEFKIAGGNVSGHVSTGKELDTFGEKWDVDLTFAAPLPAKLRNTSAPAPKPVAGSPDKPADSEKDEPAPKHAAGSLIAARKLPLPKDAADVDFKAAVEQIHFSTPRSVAAVTKEFSASLKQQGWKGWRWKFGRETKCNPQARAGRRKADDHDSARTRRQRGEDLRRRPRLDRRRRSNSRLRTQKSHQHPRR
jgi:hypothetical protein